MMGKFLLILFGIVLSALAAFLGLSLTKMIGDGTFVGLIIFITPIIGFVIFKKVSKHWLKEIEQVSLTAMRKYLDSVGSRTPDDYAKFEDEI